MSYQSTVDIIRAAAEAVNPDGFFVHGRRSDVTTHHDKPMPQISLLPMRSRPDRRNDNERYSIVMGFFDQDTPTTSELEREKIIAAMDELSNEFMDKLNENKTCTIEGENKTPEYRQLAGTLSGYSIAFDLICKMEC